MARGTFRCTECGDSVYFNVGRNRRETDRHATWLESQGALCEKCKEKARQEENTINAAKNSAAGLPPLTGSGPQIAWAETIRADKLETVEKYLSLQLDGMYVAAYWGSHHDRDRVMMNDSPFIDYAVLLLKKQTSARWWIDNRERKLGFLLCELFVQNPPILEEPAEVLDAKAEVQAEATVRPESPLTETIAEIRIHETSVEILFPEKREDFWQVVKKQLRYEWSGSSWKRTLSDINGSPADRAAEVGNRLLAAGFIVRIFDLDIREAAINATFEPECHRWIQVRSKGPYTGWLVPTWGERNERLYNAARKLKGSKYDSPFVCVPIEQFVEVEDFADMYEFHISPKAKAVIDQARKARDAQMVAKPIKPEPQRLPQPGDKPRKLAVPETVEVADEFKD